MTSSSDMISTREEVNELFKQLGQFLNQSVEALLIGGATMLELKLKDATKDIDVVCRNEEDKELLLEAAIALGFQIVGPQKRHMRLGINRLAVKGGRNLDFFAGRISTTSASPKLYGKGRSSPGPTEAWLSGMQPWRTSLS